MASARQIAEMLTKQFLDEGNFSAAAGPTSGMAQPLPASTFESQEEARAFASLAVQAVGYEETEANDRVHIYATKGSNKMFKELPEAIADTPIKVSRIGNLVVKPEAASGKIHRGHVFMRNTRIACGSSCAPTTERLAGTIGAIIRKKGMPNLFLLSNNHVFACCNHTPIGMPIMSPSDLDGSPTTPAPQEVGRHAEIIELRSGFPQLVPVCQMDVAIATVTNKDKMTSWQGDDLNGYDTPTSVIPISSGIRVKKFGRTTGFSVGTIEAHIPSPMTITYNSTNFKGVVWFQNVWTVRADAGSAFALQGDSGSLVVTEDHQAALGLVFAATNSGEVAWIIPIEDVLQCFGGMELVGNLGM